jgi:hypothetical protein
MLLIYEKEASVSPLIIYRCGSNSSASFLYSVSDFFIFPLIIDTRKKNY